MKTIDEIKAIWEIDKVAFEKKEVGGLQAFVQDFMECKELLDLKLGYESTPNENRKFEFTKEKNKDGSKNRADFVIFIKGEEIVIPVEVEKHTNIQEGEYQIFKYQKDWQKAYGILTDGFHWRFYNNNLYKEFSLDVMLADPSQLKTFWDDYLKEENYYLTFFEETGQLSLFKEKEFLNVDEKRELFFRDITALIRQFKDKLGIVGYLEEQGTVDSDKKATEISYAYFIQFILYKNLVDNCYTQFNQEFEKRISNIHNCLKNKAYHGITAQIYGISKFISNELYKPFNKEQQFINEKLDAVLRKADVRLEEVTLWLDIIVFIKRYNFENMRNEIFGYIYENYLKELYEETNKGQYFTDPAVVEFMLDEIGYTQKVIRKLYEQKKLDKLSIIDPSCGSGTFLYSAVSRIVEALFDGTREKSKEIEEIVNTNIFGLDIAEFPLYLAEMNILMRMLPLIVNEKYNNPIDKKIKMFKTLDSISEFMDTGVIAKVDKTKEDSGQLKIKFESSLLDLSYDSYIRDEDDLKEMKQSMRPPRRRFDFVIGNPPYIGYNTCCKQKMLFTELTKQKQISMNNIYGVNLNTVPNRIKTYSPKPNLYAFFIALGGGLLKSNGKICYIIPQTILTANDLDVLRYYLAKETVIEKIITFDGKLFIGRGIKQKRPVATSSLIFILSKRECIEDHKVIIINYNECTENNFENLFKNKKHKKTREISQQELLNHVENWNFIKHSIAQIDLINKYKDFSSTIKEYRKSLDDYDKLMFDKGLVFKTNDVTPIQSDYQLVENTTNTRIKLQHKYISENKLEIPDGSQGIKVYQKAYKIIGSYTNIKYYFSDTKIMINSNWIIISSDDKSEILYFLALLNSSINKYIIESYAKNPNEKVLIASIKTIKEFVRIPKLSAENQHIKDEIINQTKELLDLEEYKLSDFVDFTNVSLQKFDNYKLNNDSLILIKDNKEFSLKIKNVSKAEYIDKVLKQNYSDKQLINCKEIYLTKLKNLNIIDTEKQNQIKNYLDDLVFALYFGIPIKNIGLDEAENVKNLCLQNEFYRYINPK